MGECKNPDGHSNVVLGLGKYANEQPEGSGPKFDGGKLVATCGVEAMLDDPKTALDVGYSLGRHMTGDWGDLCREDIIANNKALKSGEARLFSAYHVGPDSTKIWIITEWDRSITTILLPEEY